MSLILPGRVEVYTIIIDAYLSGLLFVLVIYTLCGALALRTVELQICLGDGAVPDSTSGYTIRFVQTVFNRTLQYRSFI